MSVFRDVPLGTRRGEGKYPYVTGTNALAMHTILYMYSPDGRDNAAHAVRLRDTVGETEDAAEKKSDSDFAPVSRPRLVFGRTVFAVFRIV